MKHVNCKISGARSYAAENEQGQHAPGTKKAQTTAV